MDLFGIKMYLEQYAKRASSWLKAERGVFTNLDMLVDWLQVIVLIALTIKAFL